MKGRIFIALVLVIAAAFAGRQMSGRRAASGVAGREETRQTYALEAGAEVEVHGINGSVEINTAETTTAEVSIVRTAESEDDLEYSRIVVEHSPSRLVVRGERRHDGFWRWMQGGGNVRQQVVLTVPRRVEIETQGVNGPLKIGEVDGAVSISGINGRVELGQGAGRREVKGVNGTLKIAVARIGSEGMEVEGVNGKVEIELKESLNADINVRGLHGNFTLDVPNVTMQEREDRSNMRARLGSGGSAIEISGVNGNVRFGSSAPAASALPAAPVIVAPAAPLARTAPPAARQP